jgi:acyl-CoA thioesterase-1
MRHFRSVFLFLLLLGSLRAAAPPKTVVFFGDSLTFGYGLDDPATQSYPALIEQKIKAGGIDAKVVNAGISGDTSSGGASRVDWVLKQKVDIFVLALGANDGLRGIDPAVTEANLNAIVARVRHKYPGAVIILAGMRMPDILGVDFVRAYDKVYPSVAAAQHIMLIPFLLDGVGGHKELNQADGIHPNAAGAAIVANNVWKTLAPILLTPMLRR